DFRAGGARGDGVPRTERQAQAAAGGHLESERDRGGGRGALRDDVDRGDALEGLLAVDRRGRGRGAGADVLLDHLAELVDAGDPEDGARTVAGARGRERDVPRGR